MTKKIKDISKQLKDKVGIHLPVYLVVALVFSFAVWSVWLSPWIGSDRDVEAAAIPAFSSGVTVGVATTTSQIDMVVASGTYYLAFTSTSPSTGNTNLLVGISEDNGESWSVNPALNNISVKDGELTHDFKGIAYNAYEKFVGVLAIADGGFEVEYSTSSVDSAGVWSDSTSAFDASGAGGNFDRAPLLAYSPGSPTNTQYVASAYLLGNELVVVSSTNGGPGPWSDGTVIDTVSSTYDDEGMTYTTYLTGFEMSAGGPFGTIMHLVYEMVSSSGWGYEMIYASSSDHGSSWTTSSISGQVPAFDMGEESLTTYPGMSSFSVSGAGLGGALYSRPTGAGMNPPYMNVTTTFVSAQQGPDFSWATTTLEAGVVIDVDNNSSFEPDAGDNLFFNTSQPIAVYIGDSSIPTIAINTSTLVTTTVSGQALAYGSEMAVSHDGCVVAVAFVNTSNNLTFTTSSVAQTGSCPSSATGQPPAGETFVPVNAIVNRNFDIAIDAWSVTTSSLFLQENTGNTSTGTPTGPSLCLGTNVSNNSGPSSTDNIVYCTFEGAESDFMATSTWYTLTLTTDIMTTDGVRLPSDLTYTFRTGELSTQSNMTPPFVVGSFPAPGEQSFSINANLTVNFPLDGAGNMVSGLTDFVENPGLADGSVTSTSNIILQAASNGAGSGVNVCATGCDISWSTTTRKLTIDPQSNLAANTDYVLTLSSSIQNDYGAYLNGGSNNYLIFFRTSNSSDSTAPAVLTMNPASSSTGVALMLPAVEIFFSKEMNASTVMDTENVQLFIDDNLNFAYNAGEELNAASTTLLYFPTEKMLSIGLIGLLEQNARYCVVLSTSVLDAAIGAALPATTKCFTTIDEVYSASAPTIMYADADNYGVWIEFDQPILGGTTAANFTLESPVGSPVNLESGTTLAYRPEARAVEIEGLTLTTDQSFIVRVANVTDISGSEAIIENGTDNVAQGVVLDADLTGGFIGGTDMASFDSKNFANFWEKPERCFSRNMLVSVTTTMECEFPLPADLGTSATFILNMPSSFNIDNAGIIASSTSFMNADINGPEPGSFGLSNIATNTTASTITLTAATLGSETLTSGQHVRFELENIINSPISGEKTISIIVKDSSGIKQGQTISAAPFTISDTGDRSISGTVCKDAAGGGICDVAGDDTAISGATIFCDYFGGGGVGSVFVGHQEATTDSNGDWTISGVSDGEYGCGIKPDPTVLADLSGAADWKTVFVSGGNKTNVDFKYADLSVTGQTLTVNITSGAALASEEVDVFCSAGSDDFNYSAPIFKALTLESDGASSTTMKLQPGKKYQCGVGPHIDFAATINGGPPPMPTFNFMPPKSQEVVVPAASDPDAVTFTLQIAGNQIVGSVQDASSNAIANVFVNAAPLNCFDASTGEHKDCFGGFTQTTSTGGFSLNVAPGSYQVFADAPGLPPSEEVQVTVATDGTVYKDSVEVTDANPLVLKLLKSSVTIAGTIKDDSGNGIQYAHVMAEKVATGATCDSFTPVGGHRGTPTDSSGNYTLYVSNGTWRIEAFSPAYGEVGCKIITISGSSSATGQDIQASSDDYSTISGTGTAGAFISAFGTSGGNNTVVDTDGNYSLKVKAGTGYSVDCYAHGVGPCGFEEAVDASSDVTVNFSASVSTGAVAVTISGITDAFVDIRDSNGKGSGTGQNNAGVYTVNLQAGTYTIRGGGPKYGELCAEQSVTVTPGETSEITCTAPSTLNTVTGRITDGSSNVAGATVKFINSSSKEFFIVTSDAQSGSNVNYSVANVQDGTYTVVASKSGYESGSITLTVSGNTTADNIDMTQATGANGDTVVITVQDDADAAYTGNAKVFATKNGSFIIEDMDKTASTASILLTNGTWSVKAVGDNGKESDETTVTITAGSLVGDAPTLGLDNSITGYTPVNETKTISPKAGGLFTADNIESLELNIPASTLHTTDTNTGNIEIKTDPTLKDANPGEGMSFIGTTGYDITPKDSSGNALGKTLYGDCAVLTLPYSDDDVTTAGADEEKLQVASLNANGEWEVWPTVVDTTNNLLVAQVCHFSSFGVIAGDAAAAAAPASPSSPSATPTATTPSITTGTNPPTVPVVAVEAAPQATVDNSYVVNEPTPLSVGASAHTVTLISVTTLQATVTIESDPLTVTLVKDEPQDLDTDGDGLNDLKAVYLGKENGSAKLEFTNLSDESELEKAATINSGMYETSDRNVTLSINATGAKTMAISNSADFEGTGFETFSETKEWKLTEGNGLKTVYVKFRSEEGGTTLVSDTIHLVGQDGDQSKADSCTLSIGKAYKHAASPGVYYITDDCAKRPFRNSETYFTYFTSWSSVKTVEKSSLDAIPNDTLGFMPFGPLYDPQYGALVKVVSDPKVYVLLGNKRHWITSETVFDALKYAWNWIENISESLLDKYTEAGEITETGVHQDGTLIQYENSPEVYRVENGKKRHIKSESVFARLKYRWDRIITIDDTEEYEDGTMIE